MINRAEYTEDDAREAIEWVMDAGPEDLTDLDLIAALATWISDPALGDITKAMTCLDVVRGYDQRAIDDVDHAPLAWQKALGVLKHIRPGVPSEQVTPEPHGAASETEAE